MSHSPHERSSAKDAGKDRNTAETILQTAALLMPDYGYSRVTMRDLASQAGIGLGTAYSHFRGKEEIAVALVARGVNAVHTVMESYLTTKISPLNCIQSLLVARVMVRYEQTQGQRHPINEGTPELAGILAPRRAAWHVVERNLLARAIQRGQADGALMSYPPEDLALPLLWATEGLVAQALQPADAKPPSDDVGPSLSRKIGQVADLLVAGIEFRRSPSRSHSFPSKPR